MMNEVWREKYRPTILDEMVGCSTFKQDAAGWFADDNHPPAL